MLCLCALGEGRSEDESREGFGPRRDQHNLGGGRGRGMAAGLSRIPHRVSNILREA